MPLGRFEFVAGTSTFVYVLTMPNVDPDRLRWQAPN